MKKLTSILIVIFLIIYVLIEFIGDSIIKSSLESNLSNSLKRETTINDLSIGYLSGKAEIKDLKISNKEFPGILLEIKNASAKLSTRSIFSNKIEIDEIILDGIDLNYYFNLNRNLKVEDNVKSIQENLKKSDKKASSSKEFIIKKLDLKNFNISANSDELNINQQISLKDMSFDNVGNTEDSKNYKTVLKDLFDKAFKSVKNKALSGNMSNSLDKIKNIDEQKIKEKIKKEIDANKDKVKNKLKKLFDND